MKSTACGDAVSSDYEQEIQHCSKDRSAERVPLIWIETSGIKACGQS